MAKPAKHLEAWGREKARERYAHGGHAKPEHFKGHSSEGDRVMPIDNGIPSSHKFDHEFSKGDD